MKLQQRDKTLNYCESCNHRKTKDSYNYFCGLTDSEPDFDFHCDTYEFDKEIDIENINISLNFNLQKGTKGFLYPDKITNLIEPQCGNWYNKINVESKKVFKYMGLMKILSIGLIATPLVFFIHLTIKYYDVFHGYFLFLIPASALLYFALRKEFISNNRIEVDKNGVTYNDRLFLWRFIESIYLKEIDNGSESEGEEYLILLLKSGKEFELDTLRITFYTNWRFKKIINTYRNIGLKSMHHTQFNQCRAGW